MLHAVITDRTRELFLTLHARRAVCKPSSDTVLLQFHSRLLMLLLQVRLCVKSRLLCRIWQCAKCPPGKFDEFGDL